MFCKSKNSLRAIDKYLQIKLKYFGKLDLFHSNQFFNGTMSSSTDYVPLLTLEQITQFNEDGFLEINDYFSPSQVQELRNEIGNIISRMDPTDYPIFTTNEQERQMAPEYFLTSGDVIRPFMEEKANNSDIPFSLRINKIGHALHDLNPSFQAVSYDPKVGRIAKDLGEKMFYYLDST